MPFLNVVISYNALKLQKCYADVISRLFRFHKTPSKVVV